MAIENIYTLGMRGIHDSPIIGTKSQPERIQLLEQIFADQRGMIAKHVNADVDEGPANFLSLQRSARRLSRRPESSR